MSLKAILLLGGYGVTEQQIARLLRRRHPDLPLVLVGRSPERDRRSRRGWATPKRSRLIFRTRPLV